ncbi:HAD family hydrolase [Patescibacteria group bacterium]|nr:HAD family hydrolase [Patescibacteria group bacterium]
MKKFKYIFDLDGTLYRFNKSSGGYFVKSQFYQDIKENVYRFFAKELKISRKQSIQTYKKIMDEFKGEVSLGVEKTFGIDRYQYFSATWNLDPEKYLEPNENLIPMIEPLSGNIAILTSAPLVWAQNALKFLGIDEYFKDAVFTGEGDIRKPNPEAFVQILKSFNCPSNEVFSIGDQEQTDILPAKNLGIKTIIVGSESAIADYSIKTISDFPALIKNIQKEIK